MARSTRRTIRNTPTPLARDLLRLANNADTLSRRAKSLVAKVVSVEKDAEALGAMLDASGEHIERLRALADDEEPPYCGNCGMSHTPPECEGRPAVNAAEAVRYCTKCEKSHVPPECEWRS